MNKITLYHNPRCSKSRMAKTLLEEKNIAFEVREYLKESLTEQELSDLITQMDISAEDLLLCL